MVHPVHHIVRDAQGVGFCPLLLQCGRYCLVVVQRVQCGAREVRDLNEKCLSRAI